MKKKGCIILIVILILVIGAVVSLTCSFIGFGSFDLQIIKTTSSKPAVALTHDDGNPQLELSYSFLKRVDQEKYKVGILVFDSSADDFKSGKQKLTYEDIIKKDGLLYATEAKDLSKLKDSKVSYILDDEFCYCEIDAYVFVIKDKVLYLSKRLITSVDAEATKKIAKMKETDKDYEIYKEFTLYSLVRFKPSTSLHKNDETGKYGLRFGVKISKDLYDMCDEVGLLVNHTDSDVIPCGYYSASISSLIGSKQVVKYLASNPVVVNEKGDADKNGKYVQYAVVFDNLDDAANADTKVIMNAYFVYEGKVIISNSSAASLNDMKKIYGIK